MEMGWRVLRVAAITHETEECPSFNFHPLGDTRSNTDPQTIVGTRGVVVEVEVDADRTIVVTHLHIDAGPAVADSGGNDSARVAGDHRRHLGGEYVRTLVLAVGVPGGAEGVGVADLAHDGKEPEQ
jgi:hypothetical protein